MGFGGFERLFGALALSFGALHAAQAQEASVSLPAINVTSPTTVATPAREIASAVTVITGADIERDHRRTVADALQAVPGLNIVQAGGPGGQTSVFMRGTGSNHVKVLIDGIDAGNPSITNGAFDFGQLLAGDIERIEVLRGPQSGLYGSDAIGGVISITTKKGSGAPKASATIEGGSFKQFNQNLNTSGSVGRFNYAFNVLHLQSSTPVTPTSLLAPGQQRNNDSYNNWTYSTRLGVDVTDDFSVSAVARYTDAKLGTTGDDFSGFPAVYPEQQPNVTTSHNLFTRGEAAWSVFDGRLKNFFGFSYSDQWAQNINPNPDYAANFGFTSPTVAPPFTNRGMRNKADWRGEIAVAPGQTVVLGLEHQKDYLRTDSTGYVDGGFNFIQTTTTASNTNNAAYAVWQSRLGERFFFAANIRTDDNETFGRYTTYRIAPVFIVPYTETKLKGAYGTGFKAPTLYNLYVNNPALLTFANSQLQPETSKGYEYGFEQSLWGDRVSFGATYFRNDIKNLISAPFNPALGTFGGFQPVNIGLAKTSGVESFFAVAPIDRVKLRADYTYTITRDETTGLGLLRRPRDKVTVAALWNPTDALALSATFIYVSSWVDTSRTGSVLRLDANPYTLVNLAANYTASENVTLFARIDNLLNYQYEDPTGFMRPGFGIYGGVRVTADASKGLPTIK